MTAADLIFDEASHTTRTPNGRDVPHVTKVLAETGVSTDFEEVMTISRRAREAVNDQRLLGSVVHADCHAFDDNELDWNTVDLRSLPYVSAWAVCRQNTGLVPQSRERRTYHPLFDYTGIYDGIYLWPRTGQRILVDLKIGDPAAAACHLQTAAYEAAHCTVTGERIDERWAIRLVPDAPTPYRITNYSQRSQARHDFRTFVACLTVYREQPARRRAA